MVTLPKGGYKKPRRINAVSISMVLLLGLMAYVGYCFWPGLALRANIGAVLDDQLPLIYRANLAPEPDRTARLAEIKSEAYKKVKAVPGLRDPKFTINIKADREDRRVAGPKRVSIRCDFKYEVLFEGLDKRLMLSMSTTSDTDAARVDW